VLVAAGVTYRRLGIPSLDRLVGIGVFYGAAGAEAPAMAGEDVYVVGGANSAGQAALHLARFAARVTVLVRGDSLAAGMSDYLITQLQATPNIEVRLHTQVVDGHGDARLEALTLGDVRTGRLDQHKATAVFVMIGAEPHTDWLRGVLELDDRGFILAGRDLPEPAWPLQRAPLPFETSLPGVFRSRRRALRLRQARRRRRRGRRGGGWLRPPVPARTRHRGRVQASIRDMIERARRGGIQRAARHRRHHRRRPGGAAGWSPAERPPGCDPGRHRLRQRPHYPVPRR
jgi:hypothetical protein